MFDSAKSDFEPGAWKLAYSMEEAAAACSLSKSALYEDVNAGLLQLKKRGARTLILAEELRRYLGCLTAAN